MPKTLDILYHATFPDYAERIREEGIAPNEEGLIHLTSNPFHSAGFIAMTGGRRWKGVDTVTTVDAKTYSIPSFDTFRSCVVFGIEIERLSKEALTVCPEDFSSEFFPRTLECYDYRLAIPFADVLNEITLKLTDRNIPMRP